MSKNNTGQRSQDDFEAYWTSLGKAAYCHRFSDQADVRGLNKGAIVQARRQPSDFLVVCPRIGMHYAEVKSCSHKTAFPFGQIETAQWVAAVKTIRAGGLYLFYLHSLLRDEWFWVGAKHIVDRADGRRSLGWDELTARRFGWDAMNEHLRSKAA